VGTVDLCAVQLGRPERVGQLDGIGTGRVWIFQEIVCVERPVTTGSGKGSVDMIVANQIALGVGRGGEETGTNTYN